MWSPQVTHVEVLSPLRVFRGKVETEWENEDPVTIVEEVPIPRVSSELSSWKLLTFVALVMLSVSIILGRRLCKRRDLERGGTGPRVSQLFDDLEKSTLSQLQRLDIIEKHLV